MFKVESYITPIILNHVAKYVKNIRPQDAQVSLWEGEVAFQNLDLRLDVLEEELKMPFEFLSGHIHELSIRVPWTKITSEPIRITINTIEFVLKLKIGHKDASSTGSSPYHKNCDGAKRKRLSDEQSSAQQSAGSGLVNKIINNINVECQNIILKYVEDDIVVSMNVQLLSFSSADENWRSAMVDVHPVSVLIRKLVKVSDLTICVDKRNAAGHIDVCQEPVLYRCSLELRFLHKYNVNTRATSSLSRLAVFTKSVDMNISSMQFPMTMRLLQMVIALSDANVVERSEQSDEVDEELAESEKEGESLLMWAWNMLPSFNYDQNECEAPSSVDAPGHIKEFCVYIEQLNFTLKNSEFVVDSIMGNTKRIRYTPVVRMSLGGLYLEKLLLEEVGWRNSKAGMSFIVVEPLGPYGGTEEFSSNAMVKSLNQELCAFTDKSLFDDKCCSSERGWCITNYDDYMARFTDDYLSYRSPILAFDSVEYRQSKPKDPLHESMDTSKETYTNYRLLSAGVAFRWNRSFLQVKHVIQDLIDSYDYPAYYADKLDANAGGGSGGGGGSPKLHPPLMEDYDALMQYIPLCIYRFDLKNISLEMHGRVEPEALQKSQRRLSSALKHTTPYFIMHFSHLDGTLCRPIDADKLVHTTCQLPNKPRVLIEACYSNYVINVKQLTLSLVNKGTKRTAKLLHIPHLNLIYGELLKPQLWDEETIIPQRKCELNCALLKIEFTKRDLIDGVRLMECILSYRPYLLWKVAKQPIPSQVNEAITLLNLFGGLKVSFQRYPSYFTCSAQLKSLESELVIRGCKSVQKHTVLQTELNPNAENWLHGQMQYSMVDATDEHALCVVAFWLEPFRLYVDGNLLELLKYQEEYDFNNEREDGSEVELHTQYLQSQAAVPTGTTSAGAGAGAAAPPLMRRSSRNSLPSRKISQPEETIHFSSERDEKSGLDTVNVASHGCKGAGARVMWDYLSSLILSIEIAKGRIDIAEKLKLSKECKILSPYTEIQLPRVTFKSTNADGVSRTNLMEKFTPRINYRENVNWIIALYELSLKKHFGDVTEVILAEIYTTITIAITHKTENQDYKSPDSGVSRQEPVEPGTEVNAVAPDEMPPVPEVAVATGTAESYPKEIDTINIHVDTTPICFYISEPKCKMLLAHLSLLSNVINLMMPMTRPTQHPKPPSRPIQIVPMTEENIKIKQFLDLETNSEHSVALEQKTVSPPTVSMLCQWTIARIVVELESAQNIRKSKIILELEDLLATVDKRDDFSKYTSKVGQFNLNYYEPRAKDGWVEQTYLRVKMLGETADMPFLNVIYTCVGLKNYYSRIGVKRKCDLNRFISEILITMQAIEVVIDLDRLTEFIGSLCVFMIGSDCKNCPRNETVANPITAADLPLIHLDSKGMTIYMPLDTGKHSCTALIWKIESMKVTPNVENPLQRTPIRADVYNKAAQLGFLTTPGAIVEDRQYEFMLRNISAASGSWDDILNLLHEKAKTFYDTNPALEWNSQNRGSQTSLQIMDIFNGFTFICTFAPCITYNNILICGQATEFNCASDFVANINTFQLNLLSCMVTAIADIGNLIQHTCHQSKVKKMPPSANCSSGGSSTTYLSVKSSTSMNRYIPVDQFKDVLGSSTMFDSIDEDTEHNVKTDSGFQSSRSRRQRLERPSITSQVDRNDNYNSIPYTVSLVAGIFVINIFHIEDEVMRLKLEDLEPLFSLTISQPSFMMTKSLHDTVTQTSLFNMTISTLDTTALVRDTLSPFSIVVFDTLPGELSGTGIPPPLCTLRTHQTKLNIVEADMEVSKPIVVTLDEAHLLQVLRNAVTIYEALLESNCFSVRTARAVLRASKIQIMRHEFFSADRIHLKFVKVIVIFKHAADYNCKAVCAESQLHVKFLTRPEKANVSAVIGSFHVQTGHKIFLHPTTVRITLNFVSEPWHSLPLVIATAKFSVVHLDVGVYGLRELRHAIVGSERVTASFSAEWKKFLQNRPSMGTSLVDRDRLVLISKPSAAKLARLQQEQRKKKKNQREEYYQDDLRAGAFQFVEMATDAFLPLPYQIQIIRKNFGIICWRYPQPRKMVKIHIFPVPMAKPIHIKCRMEYFSEPHESFLHFCDFWLSETVSKQITLPERDICSNIWRVVILQSLISVNGECFDTSEEEDDKEKVHPRKIPSLKIEEIFKFDRKDSDFILHPRVLVGCMRIDTSFQSASVPKMQLLVSCSALQVKLLNQPNENSGLPPLLKYYRLSQTTQISQTFLVVLLERVSFHAAFISKRIYTVDSSLTLSVKCLDNGFLNMLPLMEEATLQSCLQVNDVKGTLNVNTVVDKIRLNLGPAIIHTLLTSKAHWEELLDLIGTRNRNALIPKCVVVNRTYSHVSFGQTGTTERIHLQPKECQLYYFCSDHHNQELTFFIADNETHITDASPSVPIFFRFEGDTMLQPIRIGDKCLFITSRKLSATQIIVLIKGQIEVVSMVPHDLRMDFHCVDEKQEEKQPQEYMIENKNRASFYFAVQRNSNITMRLKFTNAKGKGRTGDIPLRQNKKLPWLVKVPTINSEFISLWVRIVREDVSSLQHETFEPQRILVTIWPIFEVRSMLPSPVSVEESITKENFELAPAGGSHVLSVPATHLTEHTITLKYSFPLSNESKSEYPLSLKNMEWNKFFWYDEQAWGIEDALYKLSKEPPSKWPLDDEDELRVQRTSVNTTMADVRYSCSPARDFSCTTCLEVSPWGLFINATGFEVSICDCETRSRISVNSNELEMLPSFKSAFTVDLPCDADWISSLPIYYESKTPPNGVTRYRVLPQNGSIDIVLLRNDEIFKFVLELKVDNERRVFKLRPKYAVMNFTKMRLHVLSFAMDHKESAKREALEMLDADAEKLELDPVQSVNNCIGCTLDYFNDLKVSSKSNRSRDTAFVYFVCIKVAENSDISIPIPLSMTFTRRCFSIQNGSESVPLVVTLIEKDRIFYLNIFKDITPAILVNNQTDVKFVIAQTSASENSRVTNTTPEYEGRHFEWFQQVPAYSQCYYTPPELYASFPDVESTMCNLTLALCDEKPTKKNLKWSKPIRTDKTWEKFLHIPNHGDVKVIICDKHRVIQVFIYYIAQMEFSVKDLRSRLLAPQPLSGQAENADADNISQSNSISSLTPSVAIADTNTLLATPSKCIHFSNVCETKTLLKVRFFVKEILLSLQTDSKERDFIKTEIFGMYVDDFVMAYDDDEDRRELNVVLPNLQIDNQIYSSGKYDFPVVLCAQELYERTAIVPSVYYLDRTYQSLSNRTPMGRFTFKFFQDELKLSSIVCGLSPVRAYIEDAYLNDLLDAIVECAPSNCAYKPERQTDRIVLAKGQLLLPRDVAAQAIWIAEPLQLRSFEIQPLNVLLSVHTSLRLYIALDHSPLSFSMYNRQHILTTPLRFGQSLGMHYLSGAIFGAGWVVGSLEILGSPSGLARSFSTGLRDFVSMPMEGLFRGPWGFIVGVTQGSASLLRNITTGTVNSVTKLASSVARNLDRLTLDQEHIERTEALRRCRPQGFTDGFSQGITGLGISILGAVGGLARHTLEARSPVEVVTGMGKGIVGALTKPISGAAELLALAGQGMLHTVGFNAMPDQRAPSVHQNMAIEPSAYRIWKLLPSVLKSDQILFNHEVTLVVQDQLRRGYAFLTSAVFAIMEAQCDSLVCVFPIDKVEMTCDADDKTLYYIHLVKDKEDADEDINYTNQRIMTFLHSSYSLKFMATTESFVDLLHTHEQEFQANRRRKLDWAFYISEALGEHIMSYLKIMNRNC